IQRRHQAWSQNRPQNLCPNPAPGKRPHQNRALPSRKRNHALKRRQRRKKKQPKKHRIRKTKPPLPDPKRNRTKKLRRLEKATWAEKPGLLPIRPTQVGTAICCTIAFIANGSSQPPWSPAEQSFRHRQKSESKKTPDKKDKTASTRSEKESNEKTATTGKGNLGGKTGATANPANTSWYGNMLHDRFYREWEQPTTVVAGGAKLSASAKIRIEK